MARKRIKYDKDKFSVEFVDHNSEKIVKDLICLEEKCFPMEMRNPNDDYFSNVLNDPQNISVLLKYNGKVVGFLAAKEYKKVYDNLSNHDPDLRKNKKKLFYIDLIQIHPRFKINGGLSLLVSKLIEKAMEKNLQGFCLHARTKNGLSHFLQKMLKCRRLHSIDNWLGFGETFDYLEFVINKKLIRRIIDRLNPLRMIS